jgi:hypothetical protein
MHIGVSLQLGGHLLGVNLLKVLIPFVAAVQDSKIFKKIRNSKKFKKIRNLKNSRIFIEGESHVRMF